MKYKLLLYNIKYLLKYVVYILTTILMEIKKYYRENLLTIKQQNLII